MPVDDRPAGSLAVGFFTSLS